MSRKPAWPPSPDKLKQMVDDYFENLPEDVFPDEAGMILEMGLFPDEVTDLCDGDDPKSRKYQRVFQYAELKRESWLSRMTASDSKLAAGAFNLLKQRKNGGYTSASAPNRGNTLRLITDGVGGMEAFE